MLGAYVASVPAQQRLGKRWFSGSADAILQSLNLVLDEKPDIIVVVGADHVYRMDFSQMIDAHIASGMGVTVAAIRQPISLADQFGVIELDPKNPEKIAAFHEKPKNAVGLADSPDEVLASMGNYVFDADVLIDAVHRDGARPDSNHDMGGDIIPDFVARGEAGRLRPQPQRGARARPTATGSTGATWGRSSRSSRPTRTSSPPCRSSTCTTGTGRSSASSSTRRRRSSCATRKKQIGTAIDSIVSLGCVVSGGHIERRVLGPWAIVQSGAKVIDSVVFERVDIGANAVVQRAILDKDVVVDAGATVGVDHDADRARGFTVTETGITVVGKGVHVTKFS